MQRKEEEEEEGAVMEDSYDQLDIHQAPKPSVRPSASHGDVVPVSGPKRGRPEMKIENGERKKRCIELVMLIISSSTPILFLVGYQTVSTNQFDPTSPCYKTSLYLINVNLRAFYW